MGITAPEMTLAGPAADAPSREQVRRALAPYVKPDAKRALIDVVMDYGLYIAAIAGVIFVPSMALKVLLSLFAGIKISNLSTLAHDAAHGNLTRSARWNKILGTACFLPGLFNYRLWTYDHHVVHHPSNNGRQFDAWTPFSKSEFDALPRFRRWRERFYRMPYGLGMAPYYILERWWKVKVYPREFLPQRFRPAAWRDFGILMTYVLALLALLAAAPMYSNSSSLTAIVLGFVLPFYVWQMFFSFTSYIQHTHPDIPWFDDGVIRRDVIPPEQISLHLVFPSWLSWFAHHVYEHGAHHVNPRIPYHQLPQAQAKLDEVSPGRCVKVRFSFAMLNDTLRRCKLYDYERNVWLDFSGRPTASSPVSPIQRAELKRRSRVMSPAGA